MSRGLGILSPNGQDHHVNFTDKPEPGEKCQGGFRQMTTDDLGRPIRTIAVWPCRDPAVTVVAMRCPGCGFTTQVPYCATHAAGAMRGEVRCALCPSETAEVERVDGGAGAT